MPARAREILLVAADPEGSVAAPEGTIASRSGSGVDQRVYYKLRGGATSKGWVSVDDPRGRGDWMHNDWSKLRGTKHGTSLPPAGVSNSASVTVFGVPSDHVYTRMTAQDPSRIRWVNYPRRVGVGSVRMECQALDIGGSSTNRVDMSMSESSALLAAPNAGWLFPGDDVWMAMSFMLDANYVGFPTASPDAWMLLYQQFAQSADLSVLGGSPPFTIEVTNTSTLGSATMDLMCGIRGGNKATSGDVSPTQSFTRIAPNVLGVWHDLLIHFQYSTDHSDTNGRIRVWHRIAGEDFPETPQVDKTQVNVTGIAGQSLPVYHVTNIYRLARAETQVMYVGCQEVRRTRHEAEAIWAGQYAQYESTKIIPVHANGLNDAAVRALLSETREQSGSTIFDIDSGIELHEVDGNWLPARGVRSTLQAEDHACQAWSYPPADTATGVALTLGVHHVAKVKVNRLVDVCSKLSYTVTNAGTSLTSGQNLIAVYDSGGTRLATSVDQTTNMASTGRKTATFAGSGSFSAPGRYVYVVFLANGSGTPPSILAKAGYDAGTVNANLIASESVAGTVNTAQTTMPATLTLSSITQTANHFWAALHASSYSSTVLADSPVSYLRFDETTGTVAADSSGGGHDGAYVGAPTLGVTGAANGTGKSFSPAASFAYATIAHTSSLNVGDVLSVELWVKTTATSGTLACKGTDASHSPWSVGLNGSGQVIFQRLSIATIATSTVSVNDGAWHHVVVTKNGTTNKIYVDGVDVTGSVSNRTLDDSTSALGVGIRNLNGVFSLGLTGSIDEFALYNTELSSARVAAHYNARLIA